MPSAIDLSPQRRAWVRRRLLSWFGLHARDLPWRATRDPYAIWISEVMLQQTQVATVIPYFQRFLRSFPTIRELAEADEQQVLHHWAGLGYYRRARDLHRTARILHAEHDGVIPECPKALGAMPGLGRYTVNAVLSQAFNTRLPILETNSSRVLCRLLGMRDDPKNGQVQRTLWEAAANLLPARRVGDFNQALMELGAIVCTPAAPRCPSCPLRKHCRARLENSQEQIPVRSRPVRTVEVREVAIVLRRGSKLLLAQRPATGRWAGLWEFPHISCGSAETFTQAGARLLAELGLDADLGGEIITLKHSVTRFRITMVCLEATCRRGGVRTELYPQVRWLTVAELPTYPVSSPQRRLARAVSAPPQPRLF